MRIWAERRKELEQGELFQTGRLKLVKLKAGKLVSSGWLVFSAF